MTDDWPMQDEPSAMGTYPAVERRRTVGEKLAAWLRKLADYCEVRIK
jgi:hypothetical protein